jgi:hypothetical protein
MDDGHIAYEANDGRDVSSLSVVATSGGSPSRLARRNSLDVTSLLPDGSRVFAQLEFTDPYTIRSDLYLERRGATARLTFGARLLQPDAKESRTGAISIVAVQVLPGAARLVRVDVHAGVRGSPVLAPITDATPDTLWSDPRWSHDGARIVATRWLHGGLSDIVVLDAAGRVVTSFGRSRSVNGEPSWARGDSAVYFTSDRSGRAALYRASVSTGAVVRVADSQTGLVESEESPDGSQLATTIIRGDGYHVAVMPVGALTAVADAGSVLSPSRNDPIVASAAPSKTYSPWASLRPYYWLPGIDQTDDGRTSYGFITTGTDALYRHAYTVDATYEPRRHEPSAALSYQYAGLGNPVLGVTGQEIWDHYQIQETSQQNPATNQVIGTLDRRRYLADIAFTFLRPRVRTNAYLTLGGEMEWRDYRTDPAPLMDSLDASFRQAYTYPSLYLMAGWSNVRQPVLAISGEDGIALNATLRERWRTDNAADTRSTSVVGSGSAYKSLDFAGFAHHVIALRGAAGWEDEHATNEFDAGGVPGSSLSIAPGVNVGDAPRTFPVRGFPGGAQQGIRALAGSMEYRAPIALPDAGYKMLPLFLQRVSASLFGDAGTSWCPAGAAGSPICPLAGTPRIWMGSVGAELNVDAALEYDTPYRFRLGVATPVAGRQYFGRSNVAWYVTAGLSF